jgi:hypothetical protein
LGDKSTQKISLISIPSIFYGSSIKKGTVDLKFYVSGTMIGRLQDLKRNGELIQSEPYGYNGSGSIAGVCLYNEGFLVLTGAWDITWPAGIKFADGIAPALTASGTDIMVVYQDGHNIVSVAVIALNNKAV